MSGRVLSTSQPHGEMRSSPHGLARRGVRDLGSTIELEEITNEPTSFYVPETHHRS
jgi:hypothetical protein